MVRQEPPIGAGCNCPFPLRGNRQVRRRNLDFLQIAKDYRSLHPIENELAGPLHADAVTLSQIRARPVVYQVQLGQPPLNVRARLALKSGNWRGK
jgi:hypothetical protein